MSKPSRLKAIAPKQAKPSKPKILIYGKPGAGKTWASLDFPTPYFIDTEGGADLGHYMAKLDRSGGAYLGVQQGSLDFPTVLEQVKALTTESHSYKTLVIDSISKLFNSAVAQEADRLQDAGSKNEYGADKKPAVSQMRRLVRWLTRLDMTVILVAHEKDDWGKNAKGEREQIGSTFDCWDRLEYELHLCLRIAKLTPTLRKAYVRKTRLDEFPDGSDFNWSYADFATLYHRDVIEAKAETIELATPEQLAQLNRLLDVVELPEGTTDKWLAKASAERFEDVGADDMAKIIEHLKTKTETI